jgi:predicted RNase H-like nuclease (RuvC/YqgF family)
VELSTHNKVSDLENKIATIDPELIRDSIFNTINPQIEGLDLKIDLELQKIATLHQDLDLFKIDVKRDLEEIRQELVSHSARMTELDVKMEAVNTTVDKLKEILNKVAAFYAVYDHNWEVI